MFSPQISHKSIQCEDNLPQCLVNIRYCCACHLPSPHDLAKDILSPANIVIKNLKIHPISGPFARDCHGPCATHCYVFSPLIAVANLKQQIVI